MKSGKQILLAAGCILLAAVSWLMAATAKSDTDKQSELLLQARAYLADEIYVRAIPLLEEAITYSGNYTLDCETELKGCYLALIDQTGYLRKYTNLLDSQMGRKDAAPEIFKEAAQFYLEQKSVKNAIEILRNGSQLTGDPELVRMYEDNRYAYSYGRSSYEEVTAAAEGFIQVKKNGAWGLASNSGELVIPCIYEKISTYGNGEVIVKKDGVISAVNMDNNRIELLHEDASDFGNYQGNRLSLLFADGWHNADGQFHFGATAYQTLGTYSEQNCAVKLNDKWGVIDLSGEWIIPAQYDSVIMDELGRCWGQSRVFVRQGDQVLLLADGEQLGDSYEDARPFASGYAAVKRDGQWGFIDANGEIKIDFQFDDALSFGQHLAAVQIGENWGYISLAGEIVIEPNFLEAKSFYNGSAPIRTVDGWEFIKLLEY